MNSNGDADAAFPQPGSEHPEMTDPGTHNHTPLHEYGIPVGTNSGMDPAGAVEPLHDPSANYLDWASQFLLDGGNNDLLAGFDFGNPSVPAANNHIMHKIQFQNSVHDQPTKQHDLQHPYPDPQHVITLPPLPPLVQLLGPQMHGLGHGHGHGPIHVPQPLAPAPAPATAKGPAKGPAPVPTPKPKATLQRASPASTTAATSTASKDPKTKTRRPCDHCRRKKIRCVIIPNTENCAQCEAKSLTCTYTRLPLSKDEPAGKRARIASPADFMDPGLGQMQMQMQQGQGQGQSQGQSQAQGQGMYDVVPPNVPIRTVAPVQDYSTMNNSLLKKTLSLQFPRSSFYVGPTSYLFDTNLLEVIINSQNKPPGAGPKQNPPRPATLNKIEQVNLSDKISLRKVENKTQFVLLDDQTKLSIQTMSNDVDAIEKFIAPHGQILIDLYFRIIHPSYPILHKKVFLEKYSRTHREFSAPLLAAVYVLAIQWWDYDPQLNRFPKPNVEHILRIGLNNYILEILKRPKLSAVQAGLLLLQCKHILRGINAAHAPPGAYGMALASLTSAFNDSDYNDWVLCSQVVALAEELGLGLDCDGWKLPKWERGLRKRLAWAVYLEDKWLSLKNSRPSHINDMNWIVLDLAEEDFPEKHGDGDLKEGSSDINNGKKNFMNLISLSKILSEILNSLFSMKAMKEITDINEVLRIAKPIQLKLRTWYHSLPIELQMNSVQPRKLCSNGYLQLAYFAAELTLHRKIITTLYQQNIHGSKIPDELLNVCRSAARTRLIASIEFVKDLKPEHIHSFWHSSASPNFTLIGTFAALLFISSTSKEEARDFKEKVYDYRWVLKISAKGFVQIGDSLEKLDLVMNHIPGLLNESSEQPIMTPNVPTIDYKKAYQQQQQPPQHQQQQQQQQFAKHSYIPKNLPLLQHLQHLPQLPTLQVHNLPQLVHLQKTSAQQPVYPKSSPANEQRPFVQRHNSSGHGLSPHPGNSFASHNSGMENNSSSGSNQQQRFSGQTPHLPFDSAQAFQGQIYNSQQGSLRGTPMSVNSPQSALGRSPKEPMRQQRASFTKPGQGDVGSNHSTPAQGADVHVKMDPESARNSPALVRSPLAQLHSAKVEENGNEHGNQ